MAPTITTLTSYTTHQKYSVDFFGEYLIVTVTSTPYVIRRWIRDTVFYNRRSPSYHPLVVGVGVQWTPACYYSNTPMDTDSDSSAESYDSPAESYDSPADTLQLCVGKRCIMIQLSHCNRVPDNLRSFLTNSRTTFVGVWNSQDARKLERSRHHLDIGELLDVRKYIQDSEGNSLRSRSVEEIDETCMGYQGVRIDRQISMSDWSVDNLGLDQIRQASVDAFVCFKLGVWARLWEVSED